MLGQAVRYVLIIFVFILAIGQLGIETTLLTTVLVVLITATTLALALAFGIGSRDLARNIMAGMHLKDAFSLGQTIKVGEVGGKLVEIGSAKSLIDTEGGLISVPNTLLMDEQVILLGDKEGDTPDEGEVDA